MKSFKTLMAALAVTGLAAGAANAAANIPAWAEAQSEGVYRVNAGQTRMLEKFDTCRVIKNNTGEPIMIPASSADEWSAGAGSFLNAMSTNSQVGISACPDYFYILQGCSEADHGQGDCYIKPASKRSLTSAQVRNHNLIPAHQRPSGGCRVGSSNWSDMYVEGSATGGIYRPMGANDTDRLYFNDYWAGAGLYLDQNGSMVIPQKNFANKLFGSTVDYSAKTENSRLNRLWWDSGVTSCAYYVRTSYRNGTWVDWGDYDAGNGKKAHSGNEFAGDNGASRVLFLFVRTPGVPDQITDAVIDQYLVDSPP